MDKNSYILKEITKKGMKTAVKKFLVFGLIIFIICAGVASVLNYITFFDGTIQEGDKSNVPYLVEQYMSNIEIDEHGNITTKMTVQELWNQLVENGSRITQYLKKPEELQKLINAELCTSFLDTRPNPEEPIDWEAINSDVNSNQVQGLIQLKRLNDDGSGGTMSYMHPETLQTYIDKYKETGNEEYKQIALNHFTFEKVETVEDDKIEQYGAHDKNSKKIVNSKKIATTQAVDTSDKTNNTKNNFAGPQKYKYAAKIVLWEEIHESVTSTDSEVDVYDDNITYNMTTKTVDCGELAQEHTMPFEYMWDFLMVGQQSDYVSSLADLNYGSEIQITLADNLRVHTVIETLTYTKDTRVVTDNVTVGVTTKNQKTGKENVHNYRGGPFEGELEQKKRKLYIQL